jgi:hypothetical protein
MESLSWFKWQIEERAVGIKMVKRLTKVALSSTRPGILAELLCQLKDYGWHSFIECAQTTAYSQCCKTSRPDEAVVVFDFAENYSCLRQGEAQSAYYSRTQVTLHPMVVTINNKDGTMRDSVVGISDDLTHDNSAVESFIHALFLHLSIHHPQVQTIIVWSDGAASQYKSKLPLYNISKTFGSKEYKVVWNFYGSRHGKSAADGETWCYQVSFRENGETR